MKSVAAKVVARTALPELSFRHRTRNQLTVLAYHRIHPLPDEGHHFDAEVISATPEEFCRELQFFRRHLDVMSVRELIAGLQHPASLPSRPALITFDDGYYDNYETAHPMLRDAGLTACFLISTGMIGTSNIPWWDQVACCMKHSRSDCVSSPFGDSDAPYYLDPPRRREAFRRFIRRMKSVPWPQALQSLEQLRCETRVEPGAYTDRDLFMSWDDVRAMHSAGMEIGGHTRTHPILSHLHDPDWLRKEIAGCFQDIQRQIGQEPVAFAYPVGSLEAMSAEADDQVRRSGFKISFSYIHAIASLEGPAVRMPRLGVEYGQNHLAFRLGMARAPKHASAQ